MSEVEQDEQNLKALEAFVVDNPDLERLEALLDQFNIFEAVGMKRQEIRHSRFLAFLLDPRENHGLGDAFVKRLLQQVLMSTPDVFAPVTPVELSLWDFSGAEVHREWHHIDIFLVDEQNQLAVIIENKVNTGEHSDQLRRYYEIVQQQCPDYRTISLYLTPMGGEPSHEAYLPMSYGLVCEVLDDIANNQLSILNKDLQILITHYTGMLRRHIVGDSEAAKLARQIYQKHRRAIDLIYEHRPNPQGETRGLLAHLIQSEDGLVHTGSSKTYVWFRPSQWDDVPTLNAGKDPNNFFRFVFFNRSNELLLFLESGPGYEKIHQKLFEMGKKDELLFNYLENPESSNYPKIYRRIFLNSEFYDEDATDEEREAEISKNWAEFLEDDLPRIDAALKQESWIWQEPGEF